jgi:plastocyanin
MPEGGIVKRPMYVIPISAIAVLVFAAIAVAQSVPEGQAQGQEPSQTKSDANTTGVQNSTTVPPKKKPAETTTPAESRASDIDIIMAVDIDNHAFDPAQLNIAPGTKVMFMNNDTEAHTATADNGLFDTGVLEPGDTSWVLFEGAGTVTYHCELHPDMKGSIVVDEGAGEDTTSQKQTAKETPNNKPSIEADQPATEATQPARG